MAQSFTRSFGMKTAFASTSPFGLIGGTNPGIITFGPNVMDEYFCVDEIRSSSSWTIRWSFRLDFDNAVLRGFVSSFSTLNILRGGALGENALGWCLRRHLSCLNGELVSRGL
ncbi:uncharacterized protein VTP21DRAFT_9048 [Calcarisporiella thermophila]|uniref:uncharacterized protein n=1 Tax=Calcarisporiella thermophila TaxID=911321 RepID=UPI003743320E